MAAKLRDSALLQPLDPGAQILKVAFEGAVAQEHEDDATACWLHAVCHRMEGDLGNARYWYRRCGRRLRDDVTTGDELAEIRSALRSSD